MPLVSSVDYSFPNPRIYLGPDSVGVDLDTRLVWQEVATRRLTTPADRKFDPIIKPGGYELKRPGSYTERFVRLLRGCRIVPYDTSQTFTLIRETFSDDGTASNETVFDLAPLSPTTQINILVNIPEKEVVVITVAGSNVITGSLDDLSAELATLPIIQTLVDELHKLQGLSAGNPMTVTPTQRTAGGISLDISGDGVTSTTVTRQP